MTGPPTARSAVQEAAGAGPRGKSSVGIHKYVRVVNSVWNGSGFITRKKADRFVKEGRGKYLTSQHDPVPQFCLFESHPENLKAKSRASVGYDWPLSKQVILQELLNIGIVRPAKAIQESLTVRRK